MQFIADFPESVLTEQIFNDYLKGVLARKKKGWRDMNEESEYLFNNMKTFTLEPQVSIKWDRLEAELDYLENRLTYEQVVEFYRANLLAPSVNPVVFRVFSQKFKDQAQWLELENKATASARSEDVSGLKEAAGSVGD